MVRVVTDHRFVQIAVREDTNRGAVDTNRGIVPNAVMRTRIVVRTRGFQTIPDS
jgi:hypothetical protein